MENKKVKCSSKQHDQINANIFCKECKVYMCNKCEIFHSDLFQNHHFYQLDKDRNDIFTGICQEEKHQNELEYFCKNHNQLCCAACISKIKNKGNGQHRDCDVINIEDINQEKHSKLKDNIKLLESLSETLEKSINEIKNVFNKLNESKDKLKLKIQNIFTKIRNSLNEREDKLILEVDKHFNNIYNEQIIKNSEKLPYKIKISLEKGKIINNEWKDDNLKTLINDCINIENNIKEINKINDSIKEYNLNNLEINFYPEEEGINRIIETINLFGSISHNNKNDNINFKFKKCPNNINLNEIYTVSGEKNNIITKNGVNSNYMGIICENKLEEFREYKWKIKILKTKCNAIMVGIAPSDFDINSSFYYNYGWYFNCYNSGLYSGPPHNYNNKNSNLKKVKDEIIIVMNTEKRTLKFIIDNEDKGESYNNIPLDKPISPIVHLAYKNDSVEITEC